MTAIDLTRKLQGYKSGWVALDKKYHVIAHAKSFEDISKKVKSRSNEVVLLPALKNYFGIVT